MHIEALLVDLAKCMNLGAYELDSCFRYPLPVYLDRQIFIAATPERMKAFLHRSRAVLRMNGSRHLRFDLISLCRQAESRFIAQADLIDERSSDGQVLFRATLFCCGCPEHGGVELVQIERQRQRRNVAFRLAA